MLVCEIPRIMDRAAGALQVPAAVAKRGKGRIVYVNQRTLRSLHHYLEIERDELVDRCLAKGCYDGTAVTSRRWATSAIRDWLACVHSMLSAASSVASGSSGRSSSHEAARSNATAQSTAPARAAMYTALDSRSKSS
jgi:hypothetical protein